MTDLLAQRISAVLRDVPDFPKPGILFTDIAPLLGDPLLLRECIHAMAVAFAGERITHVVGIESRGFLFGVPVALELGVSFVPARKPGKLPWNCVSEAFTLEYGTDALEVQADAFAADSRVLIVDDILATGGTVAAACRLCKKLGANVAGVSVLADIGGLRDERLLEFRPVHSLVTF
jgi:adenine phosphoribosyltransferase